MPTILTKGLGYDEPTIIYRDIATGIYGSLVVEDKIVGIVTVEEPPVGKLTEPIPVYGFLYDTDIIAGVVSATQTVFCSLNEEGPGMSNQTSKISMFIRDDRTLSLSVNREDTGAPVDITDAKLYMTVKERSSDPDTQAIFQKKNAAAGGSDDEIDILDGPGGKAEVYIVPADTDGVNPGTYQYDIQVVLANGKTYTLTRDKIILKEDVTKTLT